MAELYTAVIPQRLAALRRAMSERGIHAYVIPSSDPHQSEYLAPYWRTREWITGFTGSSGLAVITDSDAGLWTDGRYFIQAANELDGSGVRLFKSSEPGVPDYTEWLAETLPKNSVVGFDGRVLSTAEFEKLKKALARKNVSYRYMEDLADSLWHDRPEKPAAPAFAHELRFTGRTGAQKLADVRGEMRKKYSGFYLITALDDIAWLTNMRGGDLPNTPVVFAFALISHEAAYVFTDREKIDEKLHVQLKYDGFTLCAYEEIYKFIREKTAHETVFLNPSGVNVQLYESLPKTANIQRGISITAELKAVKNEIETDNTRNAYLKEGAILVRVIKWLREAVDNGTAVNETDVQKKIEELRFAQEYNIGSSFETIAAYRENAAQMHYKPIPGACKRIEKSGFMLIDTGGQYLDGTTDITRTFSVGELTDEQKKDFTLVLKGHIALARTKFLQGTSGMHLDAIARAPIWKEGMDYRSGTGHGIGFCLNVHEGPQSISQRLNTAKLVPGMVVSNEPGIYKEGRHGIRTENILLVKEVGHTEFGTFLGFEMLSYCPIDINAIDTGLLTKNEKDFLNEYHRDVYAKLSPLLTKDEAEWLRSETKEL